MDTREVLRPYKKQRLGFEGVLIHILEPNKRNAYTYGLVFASVYAPNEDIELDHAVIKMDKRSFNEAKLELYTRYRFTAEIAAYWKTAYFYGIAAKQENFMLTNINPYKIHSIESSKMMQPTLYAMNRIQNVLMCRTKEVRHTEEELMHIVMTMENDGSVERFVDEYTKTYQSKKVGKYDVIETIYS